MKAMLSLIKAKLYHVNNGRCVPGAHADLRGDVSGLWGDVSDCDLTDAERAAGVDVRLLIAAKKAGGES
jgi:hypothetical protein